ncbi:aminotransferase class I/II-fold pyridoxal phosphate-dependent enzyme [Agrobacterium salinitolerans]|uniref:aminotransferase class I/II-fold pyridoxal phosphate-dependent enzyme n=1 Tax=Agrobacterium TaxID=357 RepID=UPI0022B83223|nr:aminotransferase class I/II-fold pyridoxal phosphate-dependent enzyme [Agrobacterium salinitolerans]MCZ7888941.1 aminotransferase class I/II-fold pyridoxal phosphate-dependent enzyme [Agrobacterium salinitolerans]
MENSGIGLHKFRNTEKMTALSYQNWRAAKDRGLVDLSIRTIPYGHELADDPAHLRFINMSSYSYLGLNRHPDIIEGSIKALRDEPITGLAIAPTRMRPSLAKTAEQGLSELFDATCIIGLSCSVITAAFLPLVSSGHLVDGKPRVTVFDRHAHFCMDMIKPICADEAPLMIAPHNDVNFLEDVCKRESRVAYVADGAYSLGGTTILQDLLYLQNKYGLFLWFDDSHSLSVMGSQGEGFVRSQLSEMNPLTAISASLNKGFGCSGGVIMLDRKFDTTFINTTSAGPLTWSQSLPTASLGSILASIRIHNSSALGEVQKDLQRNIAAFDATFPSPLAGGKLPIRMVTTGSAEIAINVSNRLLEQGFYCAPVYFPITPRGKEGLRVMLRSDHRIDDIKNFAATLRQEITSLAA